jgi:hypothetical protein
MVSLLPELRLSEFSYVSDEGAFYADQPPGAAAASEYACGMYAFVKGEDPA